MSTQTLGSRTNASFILAHVRAYTYVVKYSRCDSWSKESISNPKDRIREHIDCDAYDYMPDGWTFLGSGWSRMAFLGPDGVVYKVARNTDPRKPKAYSTNYGRSTLECSRTEAETYRSRSEEFLSKGIRLAACRLIMNSVLAMEFIPNGGDSMNHVEWSEIANIERATGLGDLHSGNVWKDESGVPTIIDYAA